MLLTTIIATKALTFPTPPTSPTTQTLLFDSSIGRVTLTHAPKQTRLLTIATLPTNLALDDATVEGVLNATEELLDDNQHFKTLWRLENCPVPSKQVLFRCMKWAIANKASLDASNTRMAIVLPERRPVILGLVDTVLKLFGPKCPVFATSNATAALEFVELESKNETLLKG